MIYRLQNYRLTSKIYSESLTCDYENLDSWLLRKKQPHIDEKELKGKNKRNASRSLELTDIRWYCWSRDFVCLLLFSSFVKIQISRYFF